MRVCVYLPKDLVDKVKLKCADDNIRFSKLVKLALERFFEANE